MRYEARYGVSVHVDARSIGVVRGSTSGVVLDRRSVEAEAWRFSGASVRHLGRLTFVCIHLLDAPEPRRPFDDWAVPVEDAAQADELVDLLTLRLLPTEQLSATGT